MDRKLSTIVLADDDGDYRAECAKALRAGGFEVIEAAHGLEALALVRDARPAMLLMDLWMPGLGGFEVLEALRVEPAGALLTIVMLACRCDSDARLECFAAGADAFLIKGQGGVDLVREVRAALARSSELIASP